MQLVKDEEDELKKFPDRKILIEAYGDQIRVAWSGYPNYLQVILELQLSIEIVKKKIQEQSIVVPSSKIMQ